ncbi:MAG: YeeE/YedE family protein [Desulfobulbus sp.]|nr:MAG: YeeE/YedE family protein [Desulfobulbus sp.]
MIKPGILFLITLNLSLGITAGFIMHRADFCVAGMFRDLFLFRRTTMLRSLLLLVVCSIILFDAARQLGIIRLYPFPLLASPALTNIAGGMIFGIGMVLAGGCVVGVLYKMGSGNLLAATAFAGLIIGSGIYAELHPWWVALARKTAFLPGKITLPQALGIDPSTILLPLIIIPCILFFRWVLQGQWPAQAQVEGYVQPWRAAIYLSILGALSYILVGMPFGVTTAYAKMAAYLALPFAPEHVAGLAFFQAVSLKYTAPISALPLQGGAGPVMDAIAVIQFPLIAGIVLGAFFSALLLREFHLYHRVPGRQYASALLGGIVLALGSRMTPGCNIWHLFGGLPILAMQSLLFLAGIFPGAWIGSILLSRFVLPSRQVI